MQIEKHSVFSYVYHESWNEIAFAPYDFIKSLGGKKYEYITPNEMKMTLSKGLKKDNVHPMKNGYLMN